MEIKIIDFAEISVPLNLELTGEEVTHTIIQGTVGTGMSSITAVLDSYIRKGSFNPFKVEKNK